MTLYDHKNEIREKIRDFLEKLNKEHGYPLENAKNILISEVMDSAYEISTTTR